MVRLPPVRVFDVERVVVDVFDLRFKVDDPALLRPRHLPHQCRRFTDQDQEQPSPYLVGEQVLLGDPMLALTPTAVDDRDPIGLGRRPQAAGEAASHAHQVGAIEFLIGAVVELSPPDPEAARVVSH